MSCDPGDERDERRLIDVTGAEMHGTGEVIKFVPKNSVTVRDEKMENEIRGRDREDDHKATPVFDLKLAHESVVATPLCRRNKRLVEAEHFYGDRAPSLQRC